MNSEEIDKDRKRFQIQQIVPDNKVYRSYQKFTSVLTEKYLL